jgi:DNA-binding response OmpR family regulator
MTKILLVEDDRDLSAEIARNLAREGYLIDVAASGKEVSEYLFHAQYELFVLDWELPDTTGPDICRQIRASSMGATPVIFLTARRTITDKEIGFAMGADDYLSKPFEMKELIIRTRALLKRPPQMRSRKLTVRNITLYPDSHEVYKDNQKVELFPKEFALLELFMSHPNQVFSPDALLKRIWPSDKDSSLDTLRMTIMRIRQKLSLSDNNPLIITLRNVGYRLEP